MTAPLGVLLMAYGSPATLHDVEAYYTHIRGGRVPSAEQVAELRARYERIGGRAPPPRSPPRPGPRGLKGLGRGGPPGPRLCRGETPPPRPPRGGGPAGP